LWAQIDMTEKNRGGYLFFVFCTLFFKICYVASGMI